MLVLLIIDKVIRENRWISLNVSERNLLQKMKNIVINLTESSQKIVSLQFISVPSICLRILITFVRALLNRNIIYHIHYKLFRNFEREQVFCIKYHFPLIKTRFIFLKIRINAGDLFISTKTATKVV